MYQSFRSELESYLTLQARLYVFEPPFCSVPNTAAIFMYLNRLSVLCLILLQASLEDKKLAAKSRTQVDDQVEQRRL